MLKAATLLKVTLLRGCFSRFLNCTKSRNCDILITGKKNFNLMYFLNIFSSNTMFPTLITQFRGNLSMTGNNRLRRRDGNFECDFSIRRVTIYLMGACRVFCCSSCFSLEITNISIQERCIINLVLYTVLKLYVKGSFTYRKNK